MTLTAIVEKFQLDADPANSDEVLLALKKRLGELHPDRNGGHFTSEECRQTFLEIQSAIHSIENSGALVHISEITALVQVLTKSAAPLNAMQEENFRLQRVSHIRDSVKAHHHGMKITSGTFLAISSAVLAFMGSLKENPFLSKILEIPLADKVLPIIWLYSGIFFAWTWRKERRAEAYAEFLSTDDGLSYTFSRLQKAELTPLQNGLFAFTRKHIVDIISPRHPHSNSIYYLLFSSRVGHAAAEAIASSQIEKLVSRGVVSRTPDKSVQEWFQIEAATTRE